MSGRVQKPRTRTPRPTEVMADTRTARRRSRSDEERAAVQEELDELLDEIDEVLSENSQELVDNYVQKGGE